MPPTFAHARRQTACRAAAGTPPQRLPALLLIAALGQPAWPAPTAAPTAAPATSPATAPATSPAPRRSAHQAVTLNFPSADVETVTRAVAALLNRPILLDPRVKGALSLYTEHEVSPAQAFSIYQAALRGLGFAVIDRDGLLTVLPEADAKLHARALSTGAPASVPAGDPVLTQVLRLQHENAQNLVAVLRPLITPNNTVNVSPGSNALVITDYASNLRRLATLVAALDVPSASDVEIIRLQHSTASELAATVLKLVAEGSAGAGGTAGGGAMPAPTVTADAASNALLVRAATPARLAAVRALVARLDQPAADGEGLGSHLVHLRHADATRLAQVLRAAFPNLGGSGAGGAAGVASSGGGQAGGGGGGGGSAGVSAEAAGSSSSARSGASSSAATTPVAATAAPSTGGGIQADPATNTLVISATGAQFRKIRALIDGLDSRRAQLYVESVIVEVDASKAVDVGLQWKSIFNLSATSTLSLGALVMALRATAGTNILSTANLVTLDNEEAKIVVGQNVPFVTGNYTVGTSSSPFQTIERKDVGITLRLRPQIGADNTVRLSIYQESSALSTTTATGTSNAGPTTHKRSIESTVVVDDGKFIVLGGLIEDSLSTADASVPGLASWPLLGGLFRSQSRTRAKSNLVVFLRPHIMRDEAGMNRVSAARYSDMRSAQASVPAEGPPLLDEHSLPRLPALAAPAVPPGQSGQPGLPGLPGQSGQLGPDALPITAPGNAPGTAPPPASTTTP
ncbi:secretin N-terminal domain-containing protein [Aquabacterium sp. OR-4]|uniref:secretin N-terminal domain-containing protein n=1 Tax=Aquabacterium sp. OR-4 TaxID=2978127 RepID=UPI0021B4AA37|nr:secretin N-terminal domain-containing protein [Aquabacterium sp. OR-4]MDT7835621.1 secretin N-terminal domain-containing protein [Aquabacterium sp. OR-4]